MKKVAYFMSLCIVWIIALFIMAFILVVCGLIPLSVGWGYALGSACGHPQLWLISVGVALLFRPVLYKAIFKNQKDFKKTLAVIIVTFGIIWLAMNLGGKII